MPQRLSSQGAAASPVHSAKRGRPPRETGQQLGRHILDTAFNHFVRQGIDRANMDVIADEAGVSKRTLYTRYGSKQGLLLAVLEDALTSTLDPIIGDIPAPGTRGKILHVARELLSAALAPQAIGLKRLLREIADRDSSILPDSSPLSAEPFIEVFHGILSDDLSLGQRSQDDLRFLAAFLFDALVVSPRVRVHDRKQLARDAAEIGGFLERTLDLIALGVPQLREPR